VASFPIKYARVPIATIVPIPKRIRYTAAVYKEVVTVRGTITINDAVPAKPCVAPMRNIE
jgi:hypothetical protein